MGKLVRLSPLTTCKLMVHPQCMQKTVTEEEKKSFKDLEERVKLLGEFDKFEDPGNHVHLVLQCWQSRHRIFELKG